MCVYKYGVGAAKARGGTVEEVRGSTQSLDHQASPLRSNDDGPLGRSSAPSADTRSLSKHSRTKAKPAKSLFPIT